MRGGYVYTLNIIHLPEKISKMSLVYSSEQRPQSKKILLLTTNIRFSTLVSLRTILQIYCICIPFSKGKETSKGQPPLLYHHQYFINT